MLAKTLTIAVFAFFGTSCVGAVHWDGFTTYFTEDPDVGFYDLPRNLNDALAQDWTELVGADSSGDYTVLGYKGDPRYGLYFSKAGDVRGVQIGFPVEDIIGKGIPIDYDHKLGIIKKDLNNIPYYTTSAFFRLEGEDDDGPRIWFDDQDGTRIVPTDTELVLRDTPWLKKACYHMMGIHYTRVNSTTDCAEIYPWFLLTLNDEVIGLGVEIVGNATRNDERVFFEDFGPAAIRGSIPDAPDCMTQYMIDYGMIFSHTWFIENPTSITCD